MKNNNKNIKYHFINPNSNEEFLKGVKQTIIEKIINRSKKEL